MSEEHFFGKVRQKAIIIKGNQILITREKDEEVWEIPGGRLNLHEDPKEGLRRELQEELGVEVQLESIVYVEQYIKSSTGEPHLFLAYTATLQDESKPFKLQDEEIAEVKWIRKDQLFDQKIYENCLNALKKYFSL